MFTGLQTNNYSSLFSGFGTGSSSGTNLNFLSNYASIKNGSYYKILKAYYNETGKVSGSGSNSNSSAGSDAVSVDKTKLTKVQTATDALKESADKLLENGTKSVFALKDITTKDANGVETTKKDYDKDAIYKAVNEFVTNYNSVVDAVNNSGSEKVVDKTITLANATYANRNLLNKVGITINDDSTLSIDKEKFMDAGMSTVKNLFNGNGSYAYRASSQASFIDSTAQREASKASTYNVSGKYSNSYDAGNLFSMYL